MISQVNKKVTNSHLQRKAYLYIRQSSIRQVRMNQESGKRQYALKQQAIEFEYGELEDGDELQQNIMLKVGDVVVVP